MKLYSLCSSSKGNCTYIGDGKTGILIDAGFGIRNYRNSMRLAGLDPDGIKAIFLTHEHSDHISGLKNITSNYDVPVYGSRGTLEQVLIKEAVCSKTKLYEINHCVAEIEDFQVQAFHTPHDSAESLGYSVFAGYKKISVCTDIGTVTDEVSENLLGSTYILLESNYDKEMLVTGSYPYFLKERVSSDSGHLSNDDCAELMGKLIENGTEHFMLGHLSIENNMPQLALQTSVGHMACRGMKVQKDFTVEIAPERNKGRVVGL